MVNSVVDVLASQNQPETLQELRDALVHEWNHIPQTFIQRLIGSMRQRCEATVAARSGHTRYWTPQTSILHDNFCLSMICSDNDDEKFCWYCLIGYVHMNLNYTIFVDFFSLCKTFWASNPCIISFVDLYIFRAVHAQVWIVAAFLFHSRFHLKIVRKLCQ